MSELDRDVDIETENLADIALEQLKHDAVSLQQLEFPRIISELRERLATPYGQEKLGRLNFYRKIDNVRKSLAQATEMQSLLDGGYQPPMGGFSDILPLLDKIKPEDAFLEPLELLEVTRNLQQLIEVRTFFNKHRESAPTLHAYGSRIHAHRDIISEIVRKIDRSGEIYDNASRELREIRNQIHRLTNDQKKVLTRLQKHYEEFLQDGILTLRDGRQVLGVIPSHVNRVNGIVHGTSATGATLFVEPMETLKMSNEVQGLRIRERTEIIKILRQLTAQVREDRNSIYFGLENVAILDVINAKGRMAQSLEACAPNVHELPHLKIEVGRHPLLMLKYGPEKVVPLTIELGHKAHTVVITGPNAGGKTVAMKTVGLLVLMTHMGIPIPAHPDSSIPMLRNILVDIGDRQSLEQDLSTFSAHIVRLREIAAQANENSLVLLDEVGTGTDPREGSALAIALLKKLTHNKALTIATTHHGELKAFAHENTDVENASMEFDLATLTPTYRLRVGMPGSSYAIEIARRYGFSDDLIAAARSYIGEEKDRLEELILNLEQKLQTAEREQREANINLSKAEALQNLYERQLADYKSRKAERKQEAEAEALNILQGANALIEKTVQDIRESQGEKMVVKKARASIHQQRSQLEKSRQPNRKKSQAAEPLKKGDRVWVDSLGEVGELLDTPKSQKKLRVRIGNVTLTLDRSGLRHTDKQIKEPKANSTTSGAEIDAVQPGGVMPELDLRGLDSHDAIEETHRYLDRALESGWEEVRIVHGKGTGTLRQVINGFLAKDKRVEARRLGKWGEGDTGVTVVKLRYL